ncbi:hypothetical protein MNBD_ALPHA06-682, partial [hydrothermal vent metagenome]
RTGKAQTNKQLQELTTAMNAIDTDEKTGTITPQEAEELRIGTGRRILALQDISGSVAVASKADHIIFAGLAALVVIGSLGLYLVLGKPELLDNAKTEQILPDPVAKLEAYLQENPKNLEGWQMLGWSYFRMGRYEKAKPAYETALRLEPENPETLSAYAETLFMLAGQQVTKPALDGFTKALQLDPNDDRARFYTGLALEQQGDAAGALAIWGNMLQNAPADAPWRQSLLAQATKLATESGIALPDGLNGPSAADIKAAQEMSPKQRQQMIAGMLARLEARLAEQPDDLAGWQQLIRSYMVLAQRDTAILALTAARAAFKDQPEQLEKLNQFAVAEGLKE